MREVGIIGVCHIPYRDPNELKEPYWELDYKAASLALEDAGLTKGDIDAVVTASYDLYDGMVISAQFSAPAACSFWKDGTNLEEDGIFAFVSAYMKVKSGIYDTVMVVSHGSMHPFEIISKSSNLAFDPFLLRPIENTYLTTSAIEAFSYMNRFGVSEEDAAIYSSLMSRLGKNNPYAHRKEEFSKEDVLSSKPVCWPIRELSFLPVSHGASALILSTEEIARWRGIGKKVCFVKGIGWASRTYQIGATDLSLMESVRLASQRAYKMADIYDPKEEIDIFEIADFTSYHGLMEIEALGLCEPGDAPSFIRNEKYKEYKIHINPSGGLICTNPIGGSGLFSVAEACMQLMGKAEGHQVNDPKVALSLGISNLLGPVSRGSCAVILATA